MYVKCGKDENSIGENRENLFFFLTSPMKRRIAQVSGRHATKEGRDERMEKGEIPPQCV